MKRIVTLALAILMLGMMTLGFTSCSKKSDWAAIEDKGYFVCGITVYAPMNYFDDDGNLTGFDTEFAQAVAQKLGVEAKFQVISWPNKYMELNSGAIDLIWNGFTYGLESDGVSRTEYVDFTYSYLENRQCLVTKADRVAELNSADALKGLKGVAEGGSSGQGVAIDLAGTEDKITTFTSQASALMELVAGNADFAVIDYQMAKAMVGQGDYATLAINNAVEPEAEVYAIGCRKGSDLTAKINEAIKALSEDGTLAALAEKYNLTNDLIPNIGSEQ
ncbi:MAG: transporter substrate-binding domain-containing protein [Clostridia bacterium]|nr:transporter substrate-binding domain-containing protein [Clostridia bacterium]